MTVLTEGSNRNAEFIISEAEHYRSRDVGTVVGGVSPGLVAGTVLGQLTAGGNLVPYDKDAVTGAEDIVGVLYQEAIGTVERTYIIRASQVKADKLVWGDGYSGGEIATGEAALLALGIIVRAGV